MSELIGLLDDEPRNKQVSIPSYAKLGRLRNNSDIIAGKNDDNIKKSVETIDLEQKE
jgi:hypothetical protein